MPRRSYPCASPVTRWSPSSPTTTRMPRRSRLQARCAARRCSGSPTSPWTRNRCGRRSPTGPVWCCSTPPQPHRQGFDPRELELMCELARQHDAWVVTDEVYEHLVFDGLEHIPVTTLPAWPSAPSRCPRPARPSPRPAGRSAGSKWPRRGRGRGADGQAVPHLRRLGPFQPAVAVTRSLGDEVYSGLASSLQRSGDLLVSGLQAAGLRWRCPQGCTSSWPTRPRSGPSTRSTFYASPPSPVWWAFPCRSSTTTDRQRGTLARFAFCKRD